MLLLFCFLFFNLLVQNSIASVVLPQASQSLNKSEKSNAQEEEKGDITYINTEKLKAVEPEQHTLDQKVKAPVIEENKQTVAVKNVSTTAIFPPVISKTTNNKPNFELDSDSIVRAVIVVCVIAILFILFLGIKTLRMRNMPKVIKHGHRNTGNNVEMQRLCVDDDDDFDEEPIFVRSTNQR